MYYPSTCIYLPNGHQVPCLLAYLHSNLLHSQSPTFPFPEHLLLFSKLSMPKLYLLAYLTAIKSLTYLPTYMVTYYISIVLCSYSLCVLLVLLELYMLKFMECIQAITTFLIPFKECFRHYVDQCKMEQRT
jgi:hypothetical protein